MIKIFTHINCFALEDDVSEWLAENNVVVKEMAQSQNGHYITLTIYYDKL